MLEQDQAPSKTTQETPHQTTDTPEDEELDFEMYVLAIWKEAGDSLEEFHEELDWYLETLSSQLLTENDDIDDPERERRAVLRNQQQAFIQEAAKLPRQFLNFSASLAHAVGLHANGPYASLLKANLMLKMTHWYRNYLEDRLFPPQWKQSYLKERDEVMSFITQNVENSSLNTESSRLLGEANRLWKELRKELDWHLGYLASDLFNMEDDMQNPDDTDDDMELYIYIREKLNREQELRIQTVSELPEEFFLFRQDLVDAVCLKAQGPYADFLRATLTFEITDWYKHLLEEDLFIYAGAGLDWQCAYDVYLKEKVIAKRFIHF